MIFELKDKAYPNLIPMHNLLCCESIAYFFIPWTSNISRLSVFIVPNIFQEHYFSFLLRILVFEPKTDLSAFSIKVATRENQL